MQNNKTGKEGFKTYLQKNNMSATEFKRLMIKDICTNTELLETGYIGSVKLETAVKALKHPKRYWRILLTVSRELMHCSPHYYRLNMFFSNMAIFQWGIDSFDIKEAADTERFRKDYLTLINKFETMNIKHEFKKIMRVLPYQDLYCGLAVESSSDYFFQEVSLRICKLFQIQDGLYNFKIDLAQLKQKNINAYPDYVQQAYLKFLDGELDNWYLPPADKQICIKLNWQWTYPYPMLIGLIKDILDLDVYKKLQLQSARTDNYKAIMNKVPIDTSSVDKPLLTPETLSIFKEINEDALSDDIGIIYTLGSDGEAISFKDSNNTRNNVSDSTSNIYDSSGVSRELFNGSSSGTAVTFSVENDSGFIYNLYRQFERWANRYIKLRKYSKNLYKFNFYILDSTIFNRDNVSKRYKEACTLGAPVIDKWLATLDMTPGRTLGAYTLHKDVFKFTENFIPLSSTYNTAEAGRPTNKEKGELLSDEGEKSADGEKHDT